jgi:hypothetical protein
MAGKWDVKRGTMSLRHGIVKLLAPKLYADSTVLRNLIGARPRPMTLFLKNYFRGEELVGAEIGTANGDNALSILQELPIKKLFLIDPYVPYVERERLASFLNATTEETEAVARKQLSPFRQAVLIKKTSDDAVRDVDEILDFVYIDGCHDYQYVRNDIANYYPLVREGGVIGGHDYIPNLCDVFQAVNEFVQQHGRLNFYAVFPDWWVGKSKNGGQNECPAGRFCP